ncbi:hypothetical protein PR202_ga24649 [Eleusine coracana subsp. coracana]|uniref:Uncharacterized protein n=1 Tax=Eleusine coracana subsp. coracana TaxID=191504 RepID=A0AAV5D8A2_ELECO|nr:hypothetical protein PR202_ga24649 [Eleusine coracana subsp. coracana]
MTSMIAMDSSSKATTAEPPTATAGESPGPEGNFARVEPGPMERPGYQTLESCIAVKDDSTGPSAFRPCLEAALRPPVAFQDIARNHLESMLLNESVKPRELPISLLESITNNFSDDQQIGSGGFAVVYKVSLIIFITLYDN